MEAVVVVAPKGRGFGRPHRFLYLFVDVYGILVLRPCPPILLKEPGLRHPASASLPLASCWPLSQQLLPVSAAGGGRRRCKWLDGWFTGRKH